MELNSSWQGCNHSISQEIPSLLGDYEVYYHINNSPPLDPNLNRMNFVHIFILIWYSHLCLSLATGSFLSFFPNKLRTFLNCLMRATYPTRFILRVMSSILSLIMRIRNNATTNDLLVLRPTSYTQQALPS